MAQAPRGWSTLVLISALNLALAAGIDPASAIWDKIERNEARYPFDRARGKAAKHSSLALLIDSRAPIEPLAKGEK